MSDSIYEQNAFTNYYVDIDYAGTMTNVGNIDQYIDDDALNQSVKFWLTSSKGERLRTNSGGYLLPILQKPMSPDRVSEIKRSITLGIKKDFRPTLIIQQLDVSPDYVNKRWKIQLTGYAPDVNKAIRVNQTINNLG